MTFVRKPVAAQTLAGTSNPAYVSINQEAKDEFSISVRSEGAQAPSTIKLTRIQLLQLTNNIQSEGLGESGVTDAMVQRFLQWPVPAHVHPDGTPGQPGRTGTNLLDALVAKDMLTHVLGG